MADFKIAVQKTLDNEGGVYHDPKTGEWANHGITHWFLRAIGMSPVKPHDWPATQAEIETLKAMTRDQAATLYRRFFWGVTQCDKVVDQGIADKLFDEAVNMGAKPAVELLQQAVNEMLPLGRIDVDGQVGPQTLRAINNAAAAPLLAAYKDLLIERYQMIAAKNPNLAHDLPGWINRAKA